MIHETTSYDEVIKALGDGWQVEAQDVISKCWFKLRIIKDDVLWHDINMCNTPMNAVVDRCFRICLPDIHDDMKMSNLMEFFDDGTWHLVTAFAGMLVSTMPQGIKIRYIGYPVSVYTVVKVKYTDIPIELEASGIYKVSIPTGGRWLLTTVMAHASCMGYVWDGVVNNRWCSWRTPGGSLLQYQTDDAVLEYPKAVRFVI